ncbi:nuclear transport factor 2 family protein [Promicromonospora sp. NPDC023805]|uniref:nuclear transport factor 2 family protein n=1 Tax=Promicromonospora sp. NPDC023805 TaxID=3154696 RepID=UPI0033D93F17
MGLTISTDRASTTAFETSAAPRDVVRRQYLASAAGDLEALRATMAPDVEWTEMAGFPLAGTYRTPEGVTANVMTKLGQEWEGWAAHDDSYVVDGENVVVLARYTATHRGTGKDLNVRVTHHFVVRGGLIVRFEQFVDTALVRDTATA